VKNKKTNTANSQGNMKAMKYVKGYAVSALGLAAVILISACGTTKETTTAYVPAPAPQIIVQAPPAVVPAPVPPTVTSSTSSDRTSNSTTSDPATGTQNSTSSHHAESTTVTPTN
jgi:hypothetical protein